jgi:adenine-specific DNA-methyltransferase
MMYPRLFLARQLLREDGVIFVSIDDREVHNLRLLLNEVFGEENFITMFVRRRRMATGMRGEPISPDHEYVVAYARSVSSLTLYGRQKRIEDYPFEDKKGWFRSTDLTVGMTAEMRPNQHYPIRNPRTGVEYWPAEGRVWRFQPDTMQTFLADDIIWPDDEPERNLSRPRYKTRFDPAAAAPVSTWIASSADAQEIDTEGTVLALSAGMNQEATKELRNLFGAQVFDYPKPVSLVRALVGLSSRNDDIVLDFFAGSATTAQAVLERNREDGGNRRFILVQLPEPTGRDDYPTIADISRERIRRVIARMEGEGEGQLALSGRDTPEDLGFKAFRLAPSNFRSWAEQEGTPNPDSYAEQLSTLLDPLTDGWTPEGVIQEVALKEVYGLNLHIERVDTVPAIMVYRVRDPLTGQGFHISLDEQVRRSDLDPLRLGPDDLFVCRDAALDDETAANLALQCRLKTM